jgi:16S rRNA (uracil1498-N3)-methyltransferase
MMHRFFAERIEEDRCFIEDRDTIKHIKVLRLKEGDRILLLAKEREWVAEIAELTQKKILAKIISSHNIQPLPIEITLAQGIPKKKKFEKVVEAVAGLGITEIVPLLCERCVTKNVNLERLRRIAKSSSLISGRLTEIGKMKKIEELEPASFDLTIVAWEEEKEMGLKGVLSKNRDAKSILVVIGPEGGLTNEEVKFVKSVGGVSVSLGSTIFRTEFAGFISVANILYEFGI